MRFFIIAIAFLILVKALHAQPGDSTLASLSLDSLLNIQISSASKYEQASGQAPATVTILTADDIRDYGFNDIMEALQVIRSLYISNDHNYSYIGVRGFSRPTDYNNRVLVLVDGVPTNDNVWGAASLGDNYFTLNLDHIERIEVIRGAASALYGSYPMMALINIVMKDGRTLDGAHITAQGGSFGRLQGSAAWGKRLSSGLDISAGGRYVQMQGQDFYFPEYDSLPQAGRARGLNGSQQGGGFAKLSWKGLTLRAMYTRRVKSIPTGSFGVIFGDDRAAVHDAQAFAEIQYEKELDAKKSILVRNYLSRVQYQQFFPFDTADGGLYDERSNGIWNVSEARFRWDVRTNNRIMIGAEWQQHLDARFTVHDEDGIHADSTYPFFAYSFYVQDEWQPLKWLSVTAGGRFDRNYGGKKAVTPRLSVLLMPSDKSTIKLIYGRAFRAPNISELEISDAFSFYGNPMLRSEFVNSYEAAWEQRIGKKLYTTLGVFYYHLDGIIDRIMSDTPPFETFENLESFNGIGAEAEVIARFTGGNRLFASASFQNCTYGISGDWVTNSPRLILKAGGVMHLLRHFTLASDFTAESSRTTVQETSTPVFLLWNGNIAFQPQWHRTSGIAGLLRHSTWSVRATNILNRDNYIPGGFEHGQAALLQSARALVFKMMWEF